MPINRGIHDKLSTLKALYPVVQDGDYAEITEEQMTYVFSKGGWNPGAPAAYSNVFIELEDVNPNSYQGKSRLALAVAENESGVVFTNEFGASKFGDAGDNFSEFEPNGVLKFNGESEVWDDIIISALNLRPGNTPPTYAAFIGGIFEPRFDAGVADEVHGSFEIPHGYKEGSNLYLHLHWSPTTNNTGNIVWGFEYTMSNVNGTFPDALTVKNTPEAAPGVINKHVLTSIAILPGTGIHIGAIIAFRLYRQNGGTDTFTGNAFLHSIGIHYRKDTVGSREIATK